MKYADRENTNASALARMGFAAYRHLPANSKPPTAIRPMARA